MATNSTSYDYEVERQRRRNALWNEIGNLSRNLSKLRALQTQIIAMQNEVSARPDNEGEWTGEYRDFNEKWMKQHLYDLYTRYLEKVNGAIEVMDCRYQNVSYEYGCL